MAPPRRLAHYYQRLIALAIFLFPLLGQTSVRTGTVLGAGEVWLYPETGGHGVGLAALDVNKLARNASFSVAFNTDTLRLHYGNIEFADGKMELGVVATGEAIFSGLLPDYYRLGTRDTARGFKAHYVNFGAYIKAQLPHSNTVTLQCAVRKWFFANAQDTASEFELPPAAWVLEPRLKYTFWRLGGGLGGRHRLFRRARGFAFGLNLGLDFRSKARQWGAYSDTAFETPDLRNNPDVLSFIGYQWMKAGIQFHPNVRVQLSEAAGLGTGVDDLSRFRVGGMNPYVIPIQGTPWAAFLSENFLSGELSVHIKLFKQTEAGIIADVVYLDDVERTGNSGAAVQAGFGAFYDMAFGNNQLDVRAGWSPTLNWQKKSGQFALFLSYGRNWTF